MWERKRQIDFTIKYKKPNKLKNKKEKKKQKVKALSSFEAVSFPVSTD